MRNRMVMPDLLIIIRSSVSFTSLIATRLPVLSVIFIARTPLPPRLVMRYSSSWLRLPKPFSLTTNNSCVGSDTQTMPTTRLPGTSSRRIPRTPAAERPMERASLSLKRTARPVREARITSAFGASSCTSRIRSPSLMVMALMPAVRGREYASSGVFFTVPCSVQNMRKVFSR